MCVGFDSRSSDSRRGSCDCGHADVAQALTAPFSPFRFVQYHLAVFENESEPAEYNKANCEIEAFPIMETEPSVVSCAVSSTRSWVE